MPWTPCIGINHGRPGKRPVCPGRLNYSYDINGRLTLTQHLVGGTEDLTQRVTYYYDSIPGYNQQWPFQNLPTGCCSNTAGRLAAVQFGSPNTNAWRSGYDVQQLLYIYSYNQAGRVTTQDLRLVGGQYSSAMDFTATYTWDNMGRMTGMNYPLNGPQVAMNYDAMSNLSSETQTTCQTWDPNQNWVCDAWYNPATLASATYNFAGQMTALSNYYDYAGGAYLQWTENHTYNGMMQLTNLTSSASSGSQLLNMTYNFSATQNNGRIVSSVDAVTGENVSYTYDSLNRLIAAATTNRTGPIWGDSYSYDGFGNLTSKVPTQGNAPPASPQVNSATNQARMIGDYGFDANGNWLGAGGSQSNTWNVENQLISNGSVDPSGDLLTYTYDPWGKRVLQYGAGASGVPAGGTVYFYSISGQRLGTYQISYVLANDPPLPQSTTLYFGSRLLAPVDRLGSVRQNGNGPIAYFPWGEERPGANGTTPDGTDKFATYFRDATNNGVGEDYASARYYNNNFGRFWSPDPGGNAHANDPQSWNRYAYVRNDPTNGSDPTGLGSVCTVFAADDSTCIVGVPAPSPSCWGGDVDDPVFTCFGEGSGMLDSAPSSSNPNLNRQTWLMYLRQQMALAAASILASNVSRAGSAQVPAFLAASSECWAPAAPSAGSLTYTLEVTYQIEDSTGAPMNASSLSGIFVNESFLSVTGSSGAGIIANAATWYTGEPGGGGIQTNGTFTDYLSAGGISGLSTLSAAAFQTFTATGILTNGMVLQSQPLTVLGFGAPTTVLNNVYTQTNVTINGFGLGTNPKTECH